MLEVGLVDGPRENDRMKRRIQRFVVLARFELQGRQDIEPKSRCWESFRGPVDPAESSLPGFFGEFKPVVREQFDVVQFPLILGEREVGTDRLDIRDRLGGIVDRQCGER